MPTKTDPGIFNCYKAALPDEPIFTILGRDPAGPATLRFWASERARLEKDHTDDDKARIDVATDESVEMEDWRSRMMDNAIDGVPPWRMKSGFDPEDHPIREEAADVPREVYDDLVRATRHLLRAVSNYVMGPQAYTAWDNLRQHVGMSDGRSETLAHQPLSRTEIEEALDYATVYLAYDENTPNGSLDDPLAGQPMTDVRRGVIWAFKRVLGLVDGEPPQPEDPPVVESDDDSLVQRLSGAIDFLRDGRAPTPYDLYRAVKNEGEGTGWTYECVGLGLPDLEEALNRLRIPTESKDFPNVTPASFSDKFHEEMTTEPETPLYGRNETKGERVLIDEKPDDLAHAPEVPPHRFSQFHKHGRYAYARGLEIAPVHLPRALDAMAEDGWFLCAIFGQTDSQHVGFIFERRGQALDVTREVVEDDLSSRGRRQEP